MVAFAVWPKPNPKEDAMGFGLGVVVGGVLVIVLIVWAIASCVS